jgi:sec-independent protein translocase protein TatB
MPLPAIFCLCVSSLAGHAGFPLAPVRLATFGVGDTLMIVVIALIVFGPKRLPEISRQVGKLLYEFRKASNDFKFQIEEELRAAEQSERQKEISAQAAASQAQTGALAAEGVTAEPPAEDVPAAESTETGPAGDTSSDAPTIMPPSSGLPVSTRSPYRATENTAGATEVTAAGESLEEPRAQDESQALEEMQAKANEAVHAAAADPSYTQSGDAVPTHHG